MSQKKQKYENYWSITFEYTDFYGEKFINCLRTILDFIDSHNITDETYSPEIYDELQNELKKFDNKNKISIRKAINEYVRLGFVNYKLAGYHDKARKFLNAKSREEKKIIFSEIVYQNASFNRNVTSNSENKEINFLLKTLAYAGPLSEDDRIALMLTDLSCVKKNFLTREELEQKKIYAESINFKERKYNQIAYFTNLISKLSDIYLDKNKVLYLSEEDLPNDIQEFSKRDPYLHRLYKSNLKEESTQLFNKEMCYLEKLDYPSLVASHIKPFRDSLPNEQYDKNNGFLLSRGMDALFDKGYISFDDDGSILLSDRLSFEVKDSLKNYSLDPIVLNDKRLEYLRYNRENVFK